MFWKVDLHNHTHYSGDCLTPPEALLRHARRKGLDKIAVTEHNNLRGARVAHDLAPDFVIVGEEVRTDVGEIIAWFVTDEVPRGLSLRETLRRLRDQGAVISVPHPVDKHRGGSALGERHLLSIIHEVDAIETLNARCLKAADNARAEALAAQYGKLRTAGSDAHTPWEVGAAWLEMPPFHSADEFRQSLQAARVCGGRSSPVVRLATTWATFWRKINPSSRR